MAAALHRLLLSMGTASPGPEVGRNALGSGNSPALMIINPFILDRFVVIAEDTHTHTHTHVCVCVFSYSRTCNPPHFFCYS